MSEKQNLNVNSGGGTSPWVWVAAAGAGIAGLGMLIRSGYEMGAKYARDTLKRYDKDEKAERKKMKLFLRHQRKMNRLKKYGP